MENYAIDCFFFCSLIVIVVFHTVIGLLPTVIGLFSQCVFPATVNVLFPFPVIVLFPHVYSQFSLFFLYSFFVFVTPFCFWLLSDVANVTYDVNDVDVN